MLAAGGAQSAQPAAANDAAAQLAIESLSNKLSIAPDSIEVVHSAVMDWPDSSIGCPRPGVEYLQVVTRGSLVLLRANHKVYRVHVGSNRALVCEQPLQGAFPRGPGTLPGESLRDLMQAVKEDLAKQLGVAPDEVFVTEVQTVVWRNSALGCPVPGQDYAELEIQGYRITLDHDGQTFRYHTNQQQVIPCPAIERE
jgi:hypothetical protein